MVVYASRFGGPPRGLEIRLRCVKEDKKKRKKVEKKSKKGLTNGTESANIARLPRSGAKPGSEREKRS